MPPKKPKPPIFPVEPRPVQEIQIEGDRLYFVSGNARFYIPVEEKAPRPPRHLGLRRLRTEPGIRRIQLTDKVVLVVRGPVTSVNAEASAYKAGEPRTKFILWAAPKAPEETPSGKKTRKKPHKARFDASKMTKVDEPSQRKKSPPR